MRPPPAEVSENGFKARITKSLTGPPSPPGPLRKSPVGRSNVWVARLPDVMVELEAVLNLDARR